MSHKKCKYETHVEVQTERQCWANAQYSRRDAIEVIGIPSAIKDAALEHKMRNFFGNRRVPIIMAYRPFTDLGRKTGKL